MPKIGVFRAYIAVLDPENVAINSGSYLEFHNFKFSIHRKCFLLNVCMFFARTFSPKLQNVFPQSCKTFFPKVANFISRCLSIVTGFAFPSGLKLPPSCHWFFPDTRGYQQPSFRHALEGLLQDGY